MKDWKITFLIFAGLYLIFDGVLSIVFQLKEPFTFQLGRLIRTAIGLAVLALGVEEGW